MRSAGERLPFSTPETSPSGSSEPSLRVIRRRSRGLIKRGRNTRLAPFAALAAICAAALIFGVLLEQVILAQSAFKLSRVRRDIVSAEARNQELLLAMTKLQSPGRIQRYARTKLGMVEPSSTEYIVARVGSLDNGVALWRPSSESAPLGGAAAPPGIRAP
ncbi:hypothetical protein BH24ACT26_BH24ACT26_05490 [soil metagenome]